LSLNYLTLYSGYGCIEMDATYSDWHFEQLWVAGKEGGAARAVAFAEKRIKDPEKLKWWNWRD